MIDKDKKTISYFDVVKLIHPDWNPDIQNPSEKMEEATRHKNDESTLYRLAITWGLIEDDSISKVNTDYVVGRGKLVKINQKYEGIIIDFKQKGQLVDVVVWVNKEFRIFKRSNIEDQDDDFYIVGYADDNEYTKLDLKYQTMHGERQPG